MLFYRYSAFCFSKYIGLLLPVFHLYTCCTGMYVHLLCGGGLYMCICSGVGESPVFQSAEYAVRAHVPVLAWDRISLYRGIRTKTQKLKHGFQFRILRPGCVLTAEIASPQLSCISVIQCIEGMIEACVLWNQGAPLIF
jgi:hypothetical protein